jgi:ABC-type polysaccharide/polyol phosphate export permease
MPTPTIPFRIRTILNLSLQLAKGQFKTRNEGSYLGIFWYLLNPILTFSILYLVFADRLGNNISYYPLYLLFGIILFNVFQATTTEATRSVLREYHHLIKSINFSRESLVLSIVIRNIYSHLFEILIFAVLLAYSGIGFLHILYYIPLLVLFSMFLYGISLLFASITVYFADLDNIWNFAIKIIWFGTPIFYAIEGQTRLFYLNLANPMYYFITAGRDMIIYSRMPSSLAIIGILAFSIGFLILGMLVFNRLKTRFAEMI